MGAWPWAISARGVLSEGGIWGNADNGGRGGLLVNCAASGGIVLYVTNIPTPRSAATSPPRPGTLKVLRPTLGVPLPAPSAPFSFLATFCYLPTPFPPRFRGASCRLRYWSRIRYRTCVFRVDPVTNLFYRSVCECRLFMRTSCCRMQALVVVCLLCMRSSCARVSHQDAVPAIQMAAAVGNKPSTTARPPRRGWTAVGGLLKMRQGCESLARVVRVSSE